MKKFYSIVLTILLMVSLFPLSGIAQEDSEHDEDLWNAVNPLNTTVTFLNTGAHPDDERSDLLAYLSRGLGVKTSSLIANRGEGGQNEIGKELGNALGIIRTNEMIEAAKITGVKAYHLSKTTSDTIYDFGFSKSPEETLEKWGEEETYRRLIRFIRTYQPDVVMPSFRDVDSQHGHHRAMTLLSGRAFKDAADPNVFPEQLDEGLSTWQVKKLYLPAASKDTATTSIEIGDYDPIYGMSYPQLGEESRYMHKSQGMGNDIPVEPRQFHLELWKESTASENDELFAGIPYDFYDWADKVANNSLSNQLQKLQKDLNHIVDLYPDRDAILSPSQKALRDVRNILNKLETSNLNEEMKNNLQQKLELKEEQLQQVSFTAANLSVQTDISSQVVTKGENISVQMEITNDGNQAIKHINTSLKAPADWNFTGDKTIKKLQAGESTSITFNGTVPADADYPHPYDEHLIQSSVSFKKNGEKTAMVSELDDTITVLPELSVTTTPEDVIVNTAEVQDEITIDVNVKNYAKESSQASVSLELPEGWESSEEQVPVSLKDRGDEQKASITIQPPDDIEEGDFTITAVAESNGERFDSTIQEISYDHINDAYYQYSAQVNGTAFELLKPDELKIGYVESGFDTIADAFQNAGFDVTKLTEEDLASADLSQYDTIVTGIRARLAREDLIEHNARLLEYAENGGHVVVQYHKPWDNWDTNTTAPYPLEIGQPSIEWRVTDENAPVTVLKPEHRLFNYPNNITENDWEDWVQERGLYFPMNWDDRYETFVSMADPNEDPFNGGILMAGYGEGTYLYTNLVFYRQIDNQVPGGYRIFTNLLSYGIVN
ncbi:NPCBM-associated, NEW3 domain of alpha-galactosidase [Lentibacillus halodurans]|uniref:NPCBM-associated, NEW3 domain of alpha-galactosidase n=1 Tax=Lentibacillus halodurans TaxID=237679 RepID=A0A1I0YBU1_9BACI|nr:PIG-L family deacetylase [Lentibacillus halodurans]SFB10652.1 NPCBM-associated, NEW3 domain of alpha-galactosidase [Lentibacillus halodurans]